VVDSALDSVGDVADGVSIVQGIRYSIRHW
jgi:hypothetical protein